MVRCCVRHQQPDWADLTGLTGWGGAGDGGGGEGGVFTPGVRPEEPAGDHGGGAQGDQRQPGGVPKRVGRAAE
eukprot:5112826-Pyramimonas_sp.AAC.2